MVEARALVLRRAGRLLLDDISTQVWPGDVVGVLGKNGAGKTTLLETLLGFNQADRGDAMVFGCHARMMSADEKTPYWICAATG